MSVYRCLGRLDGDLNESMRDRQRLVLGFLPPGHLRLLLPWPSKWWPVTYCIWYYYFKRTDATSAFIRDLFFLQNLTGFLRINGSSEGRQVRRRLGRIRRARPSQPERMLPRFQGEIGRLYCEVSTLCYYNVKRVMDDNWGYCLIIAFKLIFYWIEIVC